MKLINEHFDSWCAELDAHGLTSNRIIELIHHYYSKDDVQSANVMLKVALRQAYEDGWQDSQNHALKKPPVKNVKFEGLIT
jgi:hypothetical protein